MGQSRGSEKDMYSESLVADVFGGGACVSTEQEAAQQDAYIQQRHPNEDRGFVKNFAQGKEDFEQKIQMERRNELVQGKSNHNKRAVPNGMEQIMWEQQRLMQQAAEQREMD